MSAEHLENIGDNLGEAIAVVINNDSPASPYSAFGPRSTKALSKSRVEVRSGNFIRKTDQMDMDPQGAYFYNNRGGSVSLTVISQRHTQAAQGPDSTHGQAVGRCRWLMSRAAQKLVPPNGGGYGILDIVDMGDSYLYDTETATDRTELRFQIDLIIPAVNYTY